MNVPSPSPSQSESDGPSHDRRAADDPDGRPTHAKHELSLPVLDAAQSLHPAWARPNPVPTTLVALCPDAEPPPLDAVRETVKALLGDDFIDLGPLNGAPGGCFWSIVVGVRGSGRRILLWSELARDLDPQELDDPRAQRSKYAVLLETLLDPTECIDDLARSMRLMVALVPDCPALLDLQSRTWHLRDGLDRDFLDDNADPPDWALWTVSAASASSGHGPHWISSSGLARCGRPELEMLGVPPEHVRTAVAMVNDLAGLLLEEPTPDPGAPWSVGPEITVSLRPWRDVAAELPAEVPGSLASRRLPADVEATVGAEHPFAGIRAVICDESDGSAGRTCRCAWPADAARRIEAGGVAMYRSHRSTAREARLAQRTFPDFAAAFAMAGRTGVDPEAEGTAAFFVKAGLPLGPTAEDGHEHLWFRALRIDGEDVTGRLMHPPTLIEGVREGETVDLEVESVTSWQVICDGLLHVPDAAQAMVAAVEAHRRRAAGDPTRD